MLTRRALIGATGPALLPLIGGRAAAAGQTVNAAEFPTLQGAIDALPNDGGQVSIPLGIYETDPYVLRSNVTIEGYGAERGQDWNTTGRGSVIRCYSGHTATIGQGTNTVTIRNVTFEGSGSGAHINVVGGAASYGLNFLGCAFVGKTNAIKTTGTVFESSIRGCFVRDTTAEGIYVDATGAVDSGIRIVRTWVFRPGTHGIRTAGGVVNFSIRDSAVSGGGATNAKGIYIGSFAGAVVLEGNNVESMTGLGATGIFFCGYAATIGANSVQDCANGIYISASQGVVLNSNRGLKGTHGIGNYFVVLDAGTTKTVVMPQITDWSAPIYNGGVGNTIM